jgi:hypothetical protein
MMMRSLSIVLTCAVLLAAIGLGLGLAPSLASQPSAAAPPPLESAVRLVIDYKDGVQKAFVNLPHRADMTVLDALNDASRHPRGVKIEVIGKGETAFVQKIDDLANQGGGKSSRNWQFSINGKPGTRGCGVAKLESGDIVAWEFETLKVPG